MRLTSLLSKWWEPRPMTKEEMESEIHSSHIKGPPSSELTPEAIHETLDVLNIGKQYGNRNDSNNAV